MIAVCVVLECCAIFMLLASVTVRRTELLSVVFSMIPLPLLAIPNTKDFISIDSANIPLLKSTKEKSKH